MWIKTWSKILEQVFIIKEILGSNIKGYISSIKIQTIRSSAHFRVILTMSVIFHNF
jgi:hypothetical protein